MHTIQYSPPRIKHLIEASLKEEEEYSADELVELPKQILQVFGERVSEKISDEVDREQIER